MTSLIPKVTLLCHSSLEDEIGKKEEKKTTDNIICIKKNTALSPIQCEVLCMFHVFPSENTFKHTG